MSSFHYASNSLEDTARLGQAIADAARARLVIGLSGHLGAGKTALVRAIATALDVPAEAISSPTYVLVHEYVGRLPVYHFDTYRLESPDKFVALGAEEYFDGDGICLVEWADRVGDVLPEDRLDIRVTSINESRREFALTAMGERSNRVLDRIRAGLAD